MDLDLNRDREHADADADAPRQNGTLSRRKALLQLGAGGLAAGSLAIGAGRLNAAQAQGTTAAQANEALVHQYYTQVLNQHDANAVDALFASDYVDHAGGDTSGLADLKRGLTQSFTTFPDQQSTVEDIAADGSKVWVRSSFTATQTGALNSLVPASGKQVNIQNFDVFGINEAGKIAEHWALYDNLGMLLQLGFTLNIPAGGTGSTTTQPNPTPTR